MARRGRGEGSIYKRADGLWTAAISLGYRGGKRQRQKFYGRTRRAVAEQLDEARGKIRQGGTIPPARLTIGELVEDWLASTADSRGPGTQAVYTTNARLHVLPNVGHIRLRDFTGFDVERLQDELARRGLGPRSILKVRSVLSGALERARRNRLISHNPIADALAPQPKRVETRVLTKTEVLRFVELLHGHAHEALYLVMIGLGLRRGEVLGLRWSDLDWSTGELRVRQNLQRVQERGGRQMLQPKTDAGRRTLFAPPFVLDQLRAHHAHQEQISRLEAGARWQEQGLIFPSTIGTPLEPRNLQREFARLRDRLGVPELELRGLRHSANSLYLALGVPPHVVQAIMGHADPDITLAVYAHTHTEDLQHAAELMQRFLAPVWLQKDARRAAPVSHKAGV